ncbi:MAG: undecaprenyl diphosphate synthase [Phenylobacterium sp.]
MKDECAEQLQKDMAKPQHIGIIMDGNGRWATQRDLPRKDGHKAGAKTCMNIIHAAIDADVKVLTLYAFSTENWIRPADEVFSIFKIFNLYLETEILAFIKRGVNFSVIGDQSKLSRKTRFLVKNAQMLSRNNRGMKLKLAVNYGGKDEILRAIKKLAKQDYDFNQIDDKTLEQALDTGDCPPVDLLIRTSGEKRLSNFMIWQCAYAEYHFSDTLWPDFSTAEFDNAIEHFANRNRRFGDTGSPEHCVQIAAMPEKDHNNER